MNNMIPDKRLAAVCGLFCPACSLYIGSKEDPERLKTLAHRFQCSVEEVECHGCRSEKRSFFCKEYCNFTKCAAQKGINFCVECVEYPCADLKTFQAERPHRIELWENQDRIKKVGYERWYAEMVENYACSECRTINSAYDLTCRKCGATPSCNYVKTHKDEIIEYLSKL